MAVTSSIKYGTATAITCTLASLAASATAGRESAAVDNTSNLYVDYMLGGKITVGTTPTNNTQVEVWINGSYDGTTWAGGAAGSDAALTPVQQAKSYMRLGAILPVTATTSNVTHAFVIGSIANLFGGVCPIKWSVFVLNNSGVALNATAGNHELKYQGIQYTSA
jgi:hypothetical protein